MPQPSPCRILPTHTPALFDAAVAEAADWLKAGELVALPTETVYGLAANAFNSDAVGKIFQAKGRPSHNPVIVHVADLAMARRCTIGWPVVADRLASSFWPGPLTLVLPRSPAIPDIVTAAGDTVGIRWPSNPIIQAVIRACGFPLAAPSANPSNQVSPTAASHVLRSLGSHIRLIVDGGPCQVGIESTVLDLTLSPPRVLRPGMIHEESLLAVTGGVTIDPTKNDVLRSPGMLPKHYAPHARLIVLSWLSEQDLRTQLNRLGHQAKSTHLIAHNLIPTSPDLGNVCVIPHDPEAFARALYAELHRCDQAGATLIVIETLPLGPAWRALRDRLRRAAAE